MMLSVAQVECDDESFVVIAEGEPTDNVFLRLIDAARGGPSKTVTIYRKSQDGGPWAVVVPEGAGAYAVDCFGKALPL